MRIALGTTLLHGKFAQKGIDGIGVYTQALLQHLHLYPEISVDEVVFPSRQKNLCNSFPVELLRSTFTGLPFRGLRKIAKKVDLFHSPDHFIPKLSKTPVIASLMDAIPLIRPDWASANGRKIKNYLFRHSAKWASHYITISEAMVPDLVEHFGIKEEKITPIHLGINREDFAPISEEKKRETLKKLGLHINTYSKQLNFRRGAGKADDGASNKAENSSAKSMGFFLFIGTLQPRKNVERLIDAFSLLPTDIQQTYPLVIVGRSGWSAEKTEEKLKKLIDKGVAHWLGYISFADKVALLQTASALVFPSLYEGFGLPVLEAFASRLPVITSTVSSLPEVAGDAAYLVDPLDIEALSHAMSVVVQNPHYFQPLIEKGYARAAQMTWARCVEKTVSVYKQIIQ